MQEVPGNVLSCIPAFLFFLASKFCASPQPEPQAQTPTFLMRTKRNFCCKSPARRRLRRARELLAQIVLYGVEFGVGFEVGMDGA